MSYRGFKRLLGESSLERKSRFLLGAVTLFLIAGSFWIYERMSQGLVYEATASAGRLLATQIIYSYHVQDESTKKALDQFQLKPEDKQDSMRDYTQSLIMPHSRERKFQPEQPADQEIFQTLQHDPDKLEDTRYEPAHEKFYYYGSVRMQDSCVSCHQDLAKKRGETVLPQAGTFYGVIRIQFNSQTLEEGIHLNRAILISNALVTALLVMAGSYLIVRYVVVKPVKHLKEVSDAIANGYFNVRSEIQTGDEFEDLSFAFNRMIRNLMTKQEELSESKSTLDTKVDELAQANLALFESNKLKGEFMATMSHELRTPLHSILGFSDLLQQGDNLTEKQQRWVTNIRTSGAQLLDLINDILDLARLEAGKMEVRPSEFALGELVEEAAGAIRPLAEKKKLELQTIVPEHFPPLRQDSGKLKQVLSNLLSNAVKFTPEGGQVVVEAESDGDDLTLSVSDTGVGIAAAERETIFEKFRQGALTLTREHEGSGLGLSIVRELAKLMGGDVTLESEPGRGSRFVVRVPRRLEPAAAV